MSNFARIKMRARRALHKALSVPALHESDPRFATADPELVTVRWHTKQTMVGQLDDGGYAEMIEGVQRLVFDRDELKSLNVELRRNDKVTLSAVEYEMPDGSYPTFYLEAEDEPNGPVETAWIVTREYNQ